MNIFRLSLRNMTSRPLSTALSLILLSLGVGMIALLLQVNRQTQEQMQNNVRGIDMVVGAKGSPMQLVLSAVYHIDAPTGNISLSEVEKLERNKLIAQSIPLSYGDSYEGFRIVGTTQAYPELYNAALVEGQYWQEPFEVTVGASIAKELNLQIGDLFAGAHGLSKGGMDHKGEEYKVVGILSYSNSVIDQLILTATESVWAVHHHEEEEHEAHEEEGDHEEDGEEKDHEVHADSAEESHDHAHDEAREITALLIKFKNPIAMMQLPRMVNESTNMQAAIPQYEISRLFSLMGVGLETLRAVAFVIMLVSALSVFISLYNALKARQYEMALMRTYGASKWQVFWLVLQEGLMLSLIGFIFGILLSRFGLWLISGLVKTTYHYDFGGQLWAVEEVWLLLVSLGIGFLAAILPAIRAFQINISKTLANG